MNSKTMATLLQPVFVSQTKALGLTNAVEQSATLRFGQIAFALVSTEFGRQLAAGKCELRGAKLSGKKVGSVDMRVEGMGYVSEWLAAWLTATVKHEHKFGTFQPLCGLPDDARIAIWLCETALEAVAWSTERIAAEDAAKAAKAGAK